MKKVPIGEGRTREKLSEDSVVQKGGQSPVFHFVSQVWKTCDKRSAVKLENLRQGVREPATI